MPTFRAVRRTQESPSRGPGRRAGTVGRPQESLFQAGYRSRGALIVPTIPIARPCRACNRCRQLPVHAVDRNAHHVPRRQAQRLTSGNKSHTGCVAATSSAPDCRQQPSRQAGRGHAVPSGPRRPAWVSRPMSRPTTGPTGAGRGGAGYCACVHKCDFLGRSLHQQRWGQRGG